MPNLYNPNPYPSKTRRCFWDAEYIASQPFSNDGMRYLEDSDLMGGETDQTPKKNQLERGAPL